MIKSSKNEEQWMSCPKINIEHPGLAFIHPLNQLIVAKKIDNLHEAIGRKGVCYTIFNNEGQKIFIAQQRKSCKKFNIQIFNHYGNEVIQINKPFHLLNSNRIQVWAPPGNCVGFVEQAMACRNTFFVKDGLGNTILKVKARSTRGQYDVISGSELVVGQIRNQWHVKTLVGYNNFGVSFPHEMEIGNKAVLLGACFLIGYLKY